MTALPLAHPRVRGRDARHERVGGAVSGARRLRLVATGDGWSLVSLEGEPVFSADGLRGRWRCLEFALDRGVVALIT